MIHPLITSADLREQKPVHRDIAQTIHRQSLRIAERVVAQYRLRHRPVAIHRAGIQIMHTPPIPAFEPGGDLLQLGFGTRHVANSVEMLTKHIIEKNRRLGRLSQQAIKLFQTIRLKKLQMRTRSAQGTTVIESKQPGGVRINIDQINLLETL